MLRSMLFQQKLVYTKAAFAPELKAVGSSPASVKSMAQDDGIV